MKKLFSHDSNIIQSLILMFNLMVLNIFWLLLCVPVITAGAATTAMYYTLYQYVTDGSESVIKPFFKTFIKDFKQSTVYWLIMLVIGFVLWCDISFLSTYTQLGFLWILLGILLLLYQFPTLSLLVFSFGYTPIRVQFNDIDINVVVVVMVDNRSQSLAILEPCVRNVQRRDIGLCLCTYCIK